MDHLDCSVTVGQVDLGSVFTRQTCGGPDASRDTMHCGLLSCERYDDTTYAFTHRPQHMVQVAVESDTQNTAALDPA